MPRRSRGPRLYLRTGRIDARTGKPLPDLYYIRDGAVERGTGCDVGQLQQASDKLAAYITEKGEPAPTGAHSRSDPAKVLVRDVIKLYADERAPKLSDRVSVGGRLKTLALWWGERTLAEVTRTNCNTYVASRIAQPRKAAKTPEARQRLVTEQGARRELEDLSAAIGYWDDEHHLNPRPKVVMPGKAEGSRNALTRSQAAALLWAARGHQRQASGAWRAIPALSRARRAHMARFILIGCYTGTRAGAIKQLLWQESPLQAWVDLDGSMIYRRGKQEKETNKRRPVAKLPKRLAAHMRRWARMDAARSAKLAEEARARGDEAPRPLASVIHYAGEPVKSVRGSFEAIVADAGLSADITPHWLRHTCATWLMEANVPPWEAAAYMGMSVEVLESRYAHHRPDYQGSVTRSLQRGKRT